MKYWVSASIRLRQVSRRKQEQPAIYCPPDHGPLRSRAPCYQLTKGSEGSVGRRYLGGSNARLDVTSWFAIPEAGLRRQVMGIDGREACLLVDRFIRLIVSGQLLGASDPNPARKSR